MQAWTGPVCSVGGREWAATGRSSAALRWRILDDHRGLGDDLLARFKPTPLLDEYDVYEQLMTYWHATMHDDVFLIMNDGWVGAARPRKAIEDKDRKLTETPDLVIGSGRNAAKYKTDLVPPSLIVARYLADEQTKIDDLNAQVEEAAGAVEEYVE